MRVIKAGFEVLDLLNGEEILKKIEKVARTCYKSEGKINSDSAKKMVASLIRSGHEAMLEHFSFSVKFIVDRGVSHELVRHRLASFAQESTRYCNYSQDKFGNELTFIRPLFFEGNDSMVMWEHMMGNVEAEYMDAIKAGVAPQEIRSILPNSIKTEVVMTANLREWRHFFKLRAAGTTGKPHPQMLEVTIPLLKQIKESIPVVFDDIEPLEV